MNNYEYNLMQLEMVALALGDLLPEVTLCRRLYNRIIS